MPDTENTVEVEPLYYHGIDLPDGFHPGFWDVRTGIDQYLGRVDFRGKTVLEIGPANGFFTFEMERRGATVTCLDLGKEGRWDLVPGKHERLQRDVALTTERIEAAFWEGHRALQSKAKMVYGTVYDASRLTPKHQIGVIGNVLQHLRDPVGALMALAECVAETMIVTETIWSDDPIYKTQAAMVLVPRAHLAETCQSWWLVSVPLVKEVLKMLGFPYLQLEYHSHDYCKDGISRSVPHMTWVGHRQPPASGIRAFLGSGFCEIEFNDDLSWVWATGPSSTVEASIPKGVRGSLQMRILSAVPGLTMVALRNGKEVGTLEDPKDGQDFTIPLEGASEPIDLTLTFDRWNGHVGSYAPNDPRRLAVAFSGIRIVTETHERELVRTA